MAFESHLHAEELAHAPDARAYWVETTDQEMVDDVTDTKPLTIVQANESFKAIQTLCVREPHLFALASDLYTGLQGHK